MRDSDVGTLRRAKIVRFSAMDGPAGRVGGETTTGRGTWPPSPAGTTEAGLARISVDGGDRDEPVMIAPALLNNGE